MSEVALANLKVGECFEAGDPQHLKYVVVETTYPQGVTCQVQCYTGKIDTFWYRPCSQVFMVEQISQEDFLQWEREYEVFALHPDRVKNWVAEVTVDFRLAEVRAWSLKNGGTITGRASHMKLPEPGISS